MTPKFKKEVMGKFVPGEMGEYGYGALPIVSHYSCRAFNGGGHKTLLE